MSLSPAYAVNHEAAGLAPGLVADLGVRAGGATPDVSRLAVYALGDRFVLRRRERLLLDAGEPVELGSRAVEVLLALVEADGALLTKNALLDRVWAGVAVEENNLQVQVSAIRRALGPEGCGWIATVPGRGYRFTGPVAALAKRSKAAHPAAARPSPFSVLVLPFAGRGGDPMQGWFADAVTDSLTTDLARTLPSGSTVIAQTATDNCRDHRADVREIGRERGVRYVVEGSVLLASDRVRVNAQLVAAGTGARVWAERFDTPQDDVLRLQDEIIGRLSRAVGLQVIEAEVQRAEQQERAQMGAEDAARQLALRGLAQASRTMVTRCDAEATRLLYAAALELDPDNVDALAGAGLQRVYQVLNGHYAAGPGAADATARREAYLAEAQEKLARAMAIAPGHPAALKGRAVLLRARGLFADALAVAEALLARNPGDPVALREIGLNLLYRGRAEQAVTWLRRADALAPSDPVRWTWLQGLGRALLHLGRDAEAADALRLAVASNPGFAPAHAMLAAALALASEAAAARAAVAELRRADPDTPLEVLARRPAVPFEATDPLFRDGTERVLEGLRHAADPGDRRLAPPVGSLRFGSVRSAAGPRRICETAAAECARRDRHILASQPRPSRPSKKPLRGGVRTSTWTVFQPRTGSGSCSPATRWTDSPSSTPARRGSRRSTSPGHVLHDECDPGKMLRRAVGDVIALLGGFGHVASATPSLPRRRPCSPSPGDTCFPAYSSEPPARSDRQR